MSLEIVSNLGGGEFFKPAEFEDAKALLLEPKSFDRQVPTPNYGPKDQVTTDITVFNTDLALDTGVPDDVIYGAKIQQVALVRSTKDIIGKGAVVTVGKGAAKPGQNAPWVFTPVDKDTQAKVVEYVKGREADLEDAPI